MQTKKDVQESIPVVAIQGSYIRLDALLKWVNFVSSGGEAKLRIQHGEVQVNQKVCTQRGKKLHIGDVVTLAGNQVQIAGTK